MLRPRHMLALPDRAGPAAISECLPNKLSLAGALVDQIESTFDTVEPPADIVRPDMHTGKIDLHPGEIALESAEARDDLVQLPAVLVLRGANRPQHVEDQVSPFVAL